MMSSATLTYSRYRPPNFAFTPRPRPGAGPGPGSAAAPVPEHEAPGTTHRPSRLPQPVEAQSAAPGAARLHELADRLNNRMNPEGKQLRFSVEAPRKGAQIVLKDGNRVVNSFAADQAEMLEAYLHDMAGLHVSVVT